MHYTQSAWYSIGYSWCIYDTPAGLAFSVSEDKQYRTPVAEDFGVYILDHSEPFKYVCMCSLSVVVVLTTVVKRVGAMRDSRLLDGVLIKSCNGLQYGGACMDRRR